MNIEERTTYPVQILHKGEEAEAKVHMWTRGERDAIETRYGVRGATYLNSALAILSRNPHAQVLVKDILKEEERRLNKHGLEQEVDTVVMCMAEAPFEISKEVLMAMPDNEYVSVVNAVHSVIFQYGDKVTEFARELALVIKKDEKLRKQVAALAEKVFTGVHRKNDSGQ